MTSKELKAIEAELERRGYRKYTHPLTLSGSWAWLKNFDKEEDEEEQEALTCEKSKVLYRFRMAEACKIGNNPESDYWIGYSKAIQDLFGLEGEPCVTPKDADTVIQGWVARDKDGDVFLYQNEPDRNEIAWDGYMMRSLPIDSFPDLTWESDPEPVEITIKRKNHEWRTD